MEYSGNPLIVGTALALSLGSASVSAEINDSPYFNLWQTTETVNGNTGHGTTVDLCGTAACEGNGTSAIDYATFSTVVDLENAKGSGKIRSFLRFQHNEDALGSADTEAAFNTSNQTIGTINNPDGSSMDNQAKDTTAGPGDDFNHAIKYTDLLAADGDFSFFLDINEPGGGPDGVFSLLRLEELALFVSESDQLNEFTRDVPNLYSNNTPIGNVATGEFTDPAGTAFKVWDMDFNEYDNGGTELGGGGGGDNNIGGLLLDNINPSTGGQAGSGDYDMQLDVKKALFDQVLATAGIAEDDAYVYLYNFAGEAEGSNGASGDDGEAAAGFEEWAARLTLDGTDDTPPSGGDVPEPATAFLFLTGLAGLRGLRRRRSS